MVLFIIFTIIFTIFVSIYYYLKHQQDQHFDNTKIPSVKPGILFGNFGPVIFRNRSIAEQGKLIYNTYPTAKYVGFHELLNPIIMLRDLELIKSLCMTNFQHFTDHSPAMDKALDPLFGNAIFFKENQAWKSARSVLSRTFSSSRMNHIFKVITNCAIYFSEYFAEISQSQSVELEMKDILSRFANDVVVQIFFGIKVDSIKDPNNKFYTMGKKIVTVNYFSTVKMLIYKISPSLARLFKLQILNEKCCDYFSETILDVINERKSENISNNDMIELMIQAKNDGVPEFQRMLDILSQAFIFFFGGVETTSTAASFAVYELAQDAEVQEKLRAEIDSVLKTNKIITYEIIQNMPYLDAVVNEALRKYPPDTQTDRVSSTDVELPPALPNLDIYTAESGTVFWVPIYAIHHDPQYFANPEKFDPERFYNTDSAKESQGFMPFGIGPRQCIAKKLGLMMVKTVIFYLISRCELLPSTKSPFLVLNNTLFAMTAEGGLWIQIRKRK